MSYDNNSWGATRYFSTSLISLVDEPGRELPEHLRLSRRLLSATTREQPVQRASRSLRPIDENSTNPSRFQSLDDLSNNLDTDLYQREAWTSTLSVDLNRLPNEGDMTEREGSPIVFNEPIPTASYEDQHRLVRSASVTSFNRVPSQHSSMFNSRNHLHIHHSAQASLDARTRRAEERESRTHRSRLRSRAASPFSVIRDSSATRSIWATSANELNRFQNQYVSFSDPEDLMDITDSMQSLPTTERRTSEADRSLVRAPSPRVRFRSGSPTRFNRSGNSWNQSRTLNTSLGPSSARPAQSVQYRPTPTVEERTSEAHRHLILMHYEELEQFTAEYEQLLNMQNRIANGTTTEVTFKPELAVSKEIVDSFGPNGLMEKCDEKITELEELAFQKVLRRKMVCDVCVTHMKLFRCSKCMYSMCLNCKNTISKQRFFGVTCPHCRGKQKEFELIKLPRY